MNINDYIIVRLTPSGEAAWANHWSRVGPSGVPDSIRNQDTLPDGRVRFQLWEAMHIFGPDCFNGSDRLPFVGNEVEIQMGNVGVAESRVAVLEDLLRASLAFIDGPLELRLAFVPKIRAALAPAPLTEGQ